jgi:hypothetical protein
MLQTLIALLIALFAAISGGVTAEDFYAANCWEDEVVVQVVHDPYRISERLLKSPVEGWACVPGDNIPWDPDGFRP